MTRAEFEHIATALRPMLLSIGHAYFRSWDDAEDVAQESLLRLWRYAENITAGRNVEALAARIAKHCCIDMERRKGTNMVSLNSQHDCAADAEPSPHEQMETNESRQMLRRAIQHLNPRERQLFELRQTFGLSNDEITQQTGIAKTSVEVMVSRARRKVYEELKKQMKS